MDVGAKTLAFMTIFFFTFPFLLESQFCLSFSVAICLATLFSGIWR